MDLGLKGKRAIVTGGTRGIGLRIAEMLATEGCDVGVCARDAQAVKQTVNALESRGIRATGAAGMEIDILGTVRAVEAARRHLEQSRSGSIVAISSVAAVTVFGGVRPYNAVKAALIAYMAALSAELAPKGIRVNTVSPGTIYFEGGVWHTREQAQRQLFQMALQRNPMGRMGTPDEVARAVVFLASPAASFITGTNLIVDGGLSQRVQF